MNRGISSVTLPSLDGQVSEPAHVSGAEQEGILNDDGPGTRSDHVREGALELVGTPNLDDLQRHVLPGRPLPFL